MEIALEPRIPTYSGGLGVLAGDTIRSAADLGLPMIAVSLVYRKGYFHQKIDAKGNQREEPDAWEPQNHLEPVEGDAVVEIEGRPVHLRAWRYTVRGHSGGIVPVYLIDSDLPQNDPRDRTLTDSLYGGDSRYRLAQEIVLGIGGAQLVRNIGERSVQTYHLNEGHSALLVLSLLEEVLAARSGSAVTSDDVEAARRHCVFTTHTPVPAGHDRFSLPLVRTVLGGRRTELLEQSEALEDGELNMTYLALRGSRYVNGVAMRHGEISRGMFQHYPVHAITNGVHATTWSSPPLAELFDRHIPEWRRDNQYLRYAMGIPLGEIEEAHRRAKTALFEEVRRRTGAVLDAHVLTLGFARRATAYKRADLVLRDTARLKKIVREHGPIQFVYGGKAHPNDADGKALIRRVVESQSALDGAVKLVYLENYDMHLGALITSGVDVWLNTPERPLEASGTSGMKAALNGVPSLSILDGWWIEGHIEGVTGWAIGTQDGDPASDSESLYEALERIAALYVNDPKAFAQIRRWAITLNGSFFTTQRMVAQYALNAYIIGTSQLAQIAIDGITRTAVPR
jgi:starch phosphorylase